jgi:hypothetical protein
MLQNVHNFHLRKLLFEGQGSIEFRSNKYVSAAEHRGKGLVRPMLGVP